MRKILLTTGLAIVASVAAHASPVTLTGNYVSVGISDAGTFGSNGNTAPGILHDPTGAGNFAPGGIPNDYLTPGTPHDGFAINSVQTGFIINDNDGAGGAFGSASPTLLSGLAALGYDHAASWTGGNANIAVTNQYFFNNGDERVLVKTTLTALTDLDNVAFGRSTDPDPDVNRYGDYDTVNTRGDGSHAPADLADSAGAISGLLLGIENASGSTYGHNSGISDFSSVGCCQNDDPYNVLVGYGPTYPTTNLGDYGLQMAWLIGNMATGSTAEIDYYYVLGNNQDDVNHPTVPEPASIALLGVGLTALGFLGRRRR